MKISLHLQNTFWLYQHKVRYVYFQSYSQNKFQILIWVTLYTLVDFTFFFSLDGGNFSFFPHLCSLQHWKLTNGHYCYHWIFSRIFAKGTRPHQHLDRQRFFRQFRLLKLEEVHRWEIQKLLRPRSKPKMSSWWSRRIWSEGSRQNCTRFLCTISVLPELTFVKDL